MVEIRFLQDCYFLDTNKLYSYNDIVKIDKDRAKRLQKRGIIDILKDSDLIDKKPATENLSDKSVADLKKIAKKKGIEGYSSLNKKELIKQIELI